MLDKQSIKILKYIRKNPNSLTKDIEETLKIKDVNVTINFLRNEKYIQGKTFVPQFNCNVEPYVITPKGIYAIYEKRMVIMVKILIPVITAALLQLVPHLLKKII